VDLESGRRRAVVVDTWRRIPERIAGDDVLATTAAPSSSCRAAACWGWSAATSRVSLPPSPERPTTATTSPLNRLRTTTLQNSKCVKCIDRESGFYEFNFFLNSWFLLNLKKCPLNSISKFSTSVFTENYNHTSSQSQKHSTVKSVYYLYSLKLIYLQVSVAEWLAHLIDCGVRGSRFESRRWQLCSSRQLLWYIQSWARAAHLYCSA